MNPFEEFIRSLFEHVPPGSIEVRIWDDRGGDKSAERHWYGTAAELIDACPKITARADRQHAGVFFGVLPRKSEGTGKSEDALPGMAAWADFDFRDFEGGEAECRRMLAGFPLPPTVLVRSGHGFHAYWVMKEPAEPLVLCDLSARLAANLGGDRVADAARVMRLPGTQNHKDLEPIAVEIEALALERRYNPADFDDILPPLAKVGSPGAGTANNFDAGDVVIHPEISPQVRRLLSAHPRIRNLFEGRGKPAFDEHENRLDTTSSGYDYSLALALAKKGVTDESELATAIWRRPDDAARSKGKDYVGRTVHRVLERIRSAASARSASGHTSADAPSEPINFVVDRIRIFDSDPRIYELVILGRTLTLNTSQILSPGRFRLRFVDVLGRVPELPTKPTAWRAVVNEWLSRAEIIEQPPEASTEIQLREEIALAIESLASGDSVEDLDQGKALEIDGNLVFKTRTVHRVLKESYGEVASADLCRQLRELGYESKPVRVEEKVVRAWKKAGERGPRVLSLEEGGE